jgi:hypothetical protein
MDSSVRRGFPHSRENLADGGGRHPPFAASSQADDDLNAPAAGKFKPYAADGSRGDEFHLCRLG